MWKHTRPLLYFGDILPTAPRSPPSIDLKPTR
jgi:hypothetical protein